jgi:hypothetical protein
VGQAGWPRGTQTFDALHTVRANLDWLVTSKHAHYVAVVKKNQPLLHAKLKALPWKKVPAGTTTRETGHGRTETHALKAVHIDRLGRLARRSGSRPGRSAARPRMQSCPGWVGSACMSAPTSPAPGSCRRRCGWSVAGGSSCSPSSRTSPVPPLPARM